MSLLAIAPFPQWQHPSDYHSVYRRESPYQWVHLLFHLWLILPPLPVRSQFDFCGEVAKKWWVIPSRVRSRFLLARSGFSFFRIPLSSDPGVQITDNCYPKSNSLIWNSVRGLSILWRFGATCLVLMESIHQRVQGESPVSIRRCLAGLTLDITGSLRMTAEVLF